LGHPAEIPFLDAAFSWLPGEFQAPLPSLPNQLQTSSAAPAGPWFVGKAEVILKVTDRAVKS
jgi:hypothetical protein